MSDGTVTGFVISNQNPEAKDGSALGAISEISRLAIIRDFVATIFYS
jgi:hypothetical protein